MSRKQADWIKIAMEKAYLGWDIPSHLYGKGAERKWAVPEDAPEIAETVVKGLRTCLKEKKRPLISAQENRVYMAFETEEYEMFFGPFLIRGMGDSCKKADVTCLYLEKAAVCLSLVCYLVTGSYWSEDELLEMNFTVNNLWEEEELRQFQEFSEEDGGRYKYEDELRWMGLVERGELDLPLAKTSEIYHELYRVGIFSPKDEKKQMEYMMVSQITLSCRAAIRGGLNPQRAYHISDLYLQRLSSAKSVYEMQTIGLGAANTLSKLVREHQKMSRENLYCEKIKNYIGKNLRGKIKISDIADQVGLNASYMTHLFVKEEGTTVKTYIMREKMKLAANLLKNTQESVVTISDYLSFYSQSYFTECFRREYGLTPTEYRNKYSIR